WIPVVVAAEDILDCVLGRLAIGELAGPGHALAAVGAGAGALELGVAGGLLVLGFSPVVPAARVNVRPKVAAEICDRRVRSPGSAEGGLGRGFGAGGLEQLGARRRLPVDVTAGELAVEEGVAERV